MENLQIQKMAAIIKKCAEDFAHRENSFPILRQDEAEAVADILRKVWADRFTVKVAPCNEVGFRAKIITEKINTIASASEGLKLKAALNKRYSGKNRR